MRGGIQETFSARPIKLLDFLPPNAPEGADGARMPAPVRLQIAAVIRTTQREAHDFIRALVLVKAAGSATLEAVET
jgi:hypothetical protein